MAASEPRVRERPLSPHMQIYKWQAQMTTSIIHRATGIALSVGALGLVCGLLALASGPERWAVFTAAAGSFLGQIVVLGFVWALSYHLINGVRHLIQDGGLGFAIPDFVRSSLISIFGSIVLTIIIWAVVLLHWGQV
ncbi:MAG: succinate dehydrogenase, cytochrome b556 subunit [Thermomonas sp.]|uniref:succinate dehydrogenase, cytochrome b556 subunit n=1 Tax=Thermomonas sp. TaxID=1971895 RepID=UPI001EC3B49E|nr:succinate dehydrogenase, cytochrome b556 subunit [Thermomonas sp.]MBV2208237.1 succinate dehydrogenase, cytochrome b556 subunit [Thermomonas sp.]